MSCIYKYKGKDYTKDEFYSLVRTTMVQPKTVQKYNKILFPTGNTASKIEGHATLEEFKKQKEDRIKQLKSKWNVVDDKGNLLSNYKTKEEAEKYSNGRKVVSGEEYNSQELQQLKQELERVEKEGFGALRPIYNFYENQVKNILKKNYNVKEVTDEYGNTWNEVELSQEDVRKAILLQKEESTKQKPIKELNDKLTQLLNQIGWSVTNIDAYKEWYKQEYGVADNSPELIKGLADLTNKIIAVSKDNESITTLPEEASHAILAGMVNTPLYKKLFELVEKEPIYKEVFRQYINTYKGDIAKVKFEALGKILRDSIIKQYPNITVENKTILTGLKRLVEKFLDLFRNNKSLTEEIDILAKEILSGNVSMVDKDLKMGSKFFELDTKKYQASNDLDEFKDKLDEVIKKRITRLKIYENKGVGDYSKEEKERVDKLLKLYVNDKITLGLVEFINDIDKDAEAVWKKLNYVLKQNDTLGTAKVLRELKSYVIPFNETLKEIKSELALTDKHPEIIGEINRITSKLDDLERLYNKKSKLLLSNYLFPFAENNTDIKSPEDLYKKLNEEKDISFMSRFLDSMAETTDDILGLFDRSVKEAKEKARISAYNKQRDLLVLDKELKDSGIKDTEFIYERDSNGKITGNYVTEFNRHEFKVARQKAYESIKNNIKSTFNLDLSDNPEERELQFAKNKGLQKTYNKLWRDWILKNTQANPKAQELIEQKKQYFKDIYGEDKFKGALRADLAFDAWLNNNMSSRMDPYTGDIETYYKGELSLPANKYRNKQYDEIQANSLKRKYYRKTISLKEDLDKFLPQNIIDPYLAPQLRKDWLERAKNDPKAFIKETAEDLKLRETDTEFGDLRKLTDTEDKPVNFLPLYFTRRIQNTEDLSLDATATMAAYINMAEDYKEMNKIIHILELGEEVLAKRKVIAGESALNKIFSKKGLTQTKAYEQASGGKSYERFKDYMDMVVYGKKKADETWMNFAGYNTVKMIDAFNKYTSIVGLAGNIYSAVNNVVLGNALARQEAFAKEFIGKGGLTYADKTYWSELPEMMNSIGNPYSNSKLLQVGELMDILQDFDQKTRELNTDRGRTEKLFNSNSLYALNSMGEHQIQWRTALAVMENIKVKTKSGEEINLWEALEIRDSKAQFREDVVGVDKNTLIDAGLRIKALNQKLHGIYTDSDRSAIQKWTLGRMALVFRKWIKPGINRRFDPKRYDYSLDKHVEGMYRTTFHFLKQVVKDLKSYQTVWNTLEDYQKANVKRSALEFSYMIAAMMLSGILSNLAEDDDDNWALNFAAYEVNRLYTDLGFYVNPKSMFQIVRSPMAGVRTVQQAVNLFDITNSVSISPFDEEEFGTIKRYKGGPNKGKSKGYIGLKRMVPVVGNIERLLTPEEQLKFFTSTTFN